MNVLPRWLSRSLDVLTRFALAAAASACAMTALAPWGTATLFRNITLHIPGAVYLDGMYVLVASTAAALLCRSRIIGIGSAVICLWAVQQATDLVPRTIIKDITAAQSNLFPVNSVLDQAHLPDLTVGNWALPHSSYLDYGLGWTQLTADWLLAAAVAGLLFDPIIVAIWRRFGALPCRRCRKWIAVRRNADYCPRCGLWLPRAPEPLRCRACRRPLSVHDNFCSICGLAVAISPAEAVSL